MGKVKIYKKPNFNHKFTQDEYDEALAQVNGNLTEIKDTLNKKVNIVRQRILNICIGNLEHAFKHYYNTFTYSRDPSEEKAFKRSIIELNSFIRACPLDDSNKEETEKKITWLKNEFIKQTQYIQQVEKQIREKNIDPFTEIVENIT
ncbi:MAG: hypothetical protein JW776_16380 [Candidatus Lokiarchaeota archaeon]|nr:hypothetical protein [Candidatus Lokiarchaeota archaeon]